MIGTNFILPIVHMYLCCVKQSTLSGDGGSFSHPSPLKGLRPSNRENGFETESML